MGRRQFRADFAAAAQSPPLHITGIRHGEDGEIIFEYTHSEHGLPQVTNLQLLALNIDEYPTDNEYMIFARDGELDSKISDALEPLCALIRNKSIIEALSDISTCLHEAVTSGQSINPIVLGTSSEGEDDYDEVDSETDGAEDWLDDGAEDVAFGFEAAASSRSVNIGRGLVTSRSREDRKKIKVDLRQAKEAGFRIGVIGDVKTSGIISTSIRINKLGISEEAMQAWGGLDPSHYFVLLIRCQHGYQSIDSIKEEPTLSGSTEIRLGVCQSYKPDSQSAFDAFNDVALDQQYDRFKMPNDNRSGLLHPLFIGRPLHELFRSRFTRVIKFREVYQLGWTGAEQLVHDTQGALIDGSNMDRYGYMPDDSEYRALPPIVTGDSMLGRSLKDCSLPLIAMEFALRHFVRCTEFCLVCHCTTGNSFEALKPYVCSNPLCLYQYMGLGFGPSIEWEILQQPFVVDLLISFCYSQAQAGKLKDFPVGLDLRGPILPQFTQALVKSGGYQYGLAQTPARITIGISPTPERSFSVPYDTRSYEFLFNADKLCDAQNLRVGDFVAVICTKICDGVIYHRIEEVLFPVVKLGQPFETHANGSKKNEPLITICDSKYIDVDCYLFDRHFDELSDDYKAKFIMMLLDTIPPVQEILNFLKAHNAGQEMSLRGWRDRIAPAALNVLRWIIASNRSCIMQVDNIVDGVNTNEVLPIEDRVSGMDEYMQFRFAQGAPDKEQRFLDCVKKETEGSQYPTLFAWHGSPLHNWHSIIREGLHYKETVHGRAYGHGVYMSPVAATSASYQNSLHSMGRNGSANWPNSELKVSTAMALNEVVNKPGSFVSQNPHYVVANIDWIQTRYLMVRTAALHTKRNRENVEVVVQDPMRAVSGFAGSKISIPLTTISKSRRAGQQNIISPRKKRRFFGIGYRHEPIELVDDDDESVMTSAEDREYLLDDESHTGNTPILLDSDSEMISDNDLSLIESPRKKARQERPEDPAKLVGGALLDVNLTDFMPGALDMSNIKVLPPPDHASPSATNQLMKAFKSLMKTQSSTLAHTLGWYMDPERVENMYQWILELHSFDPKIPLASDMTKAGITSIVLEMRFTDQYPFAPPFVRVIKPRFLPFNQGGGGHVTEGGAICMELLTNNGWSAVSSIESVLLQIRLAMSEEERPARLGLNRTRHGANVVYGVGEAIAAYERSCRAHGWTVPPSFSNLQQREDGPPFRYH